MIISRIEHNGNLYFNLHSEQSVTWAQVNEPGQGIYENNLTGSTLERVLNEGMLSEELNTILDFEDILSVQNNLNDTLSSIRNKSKSLSLLNLKIEVQEKLQTSIFREKNPYNKIEGDTFPVFFISESESLYYKKYMEVFNDQFKLFMKKYSKDNFSEKTEFLTEANNESYRYHNSSSVYLNKYIDIKSMITNDQEFFINCLYELAKKIKNHWLDKIVDNEEKRKPILVCQNLNSSYMASILSSLLGLDILILDNIGPINKLYSRLENRIQPGKQYIIISDVVCLGTEVKIVKNLITYMEGQYLGNASLVRIQPTVHLNGPKYKNVETVFELNRDDNPINLKILTGLDKALKTKNYE